MRSHGLCREGEVRISEQDPHRVLVDSREACERRFAAIRLYEAKRNVGFPFGETKISRGGHEICRLGPPYQSQPVSGPSQVYDFPKVTFDFVTSLLTLSRVCLV
jgi:hypothetical protein